MDEFNPPLLSRFYGEGDSLNMAGTGGHSASSPPSIAGSNKSRLSRFAFWNGLPRERKVGRPRLVDSSIVKALDLMGQSVESELIKRGDKILPFATDGPPSKDPIITVGDHNEINSAPSPSGKIGILKQLTNKFRSPRMKYVAPKHEEPGTSTEVVAAKDRRDAALRARGLLPPISNLDTSIQTQEQDHHFPVVKSSFAEGSSGAITNAKRIQKEWQEKNTSAGGATSEDPDVVQRARMKSFRFGGEASPSLSLYTPKNAFEEGEQLVLGEKIEVSANVPSAGLRLDLDAKVRDGNDLLSTPLAPTGWASLIPLPSSPSPSSFENAENPNFIPLPNLGSSTSGEEASLLPDERPLTIVASPTSPLINNLCAIPLPPSPTPSRISPDFLHGGITISPWALPLPLSPIVSSFPRLDWSSSEENDESAFRSPPRALIDLDDDQSQIHTNPMAEPFVSISVHPPGTPSSRNSSASQNAPSPSWLAISDTDSPTPPSFEGSYQATASSDTSNLSASGDEQHVASSYMERGDITVAQEPNEDLDVATRRPAALFSEQIGSLARVPLEEQSRPPLRTYTSDNESKPKDSWRKSLNPFKRSITIDNTNGAEIQSTKLATLRMSIIGRSENRKSMKLDSGPKSPRSPKLFDPSHLPPSPSLKISFAESGRTSSEFAHIPISPRLAVSPTFHNHASIVMEAAGIEDDESRRMTELAFMD